MQELIRVSLVVIFSALSHMLFSLLKPPGEDVDGTAMMLIITCTDLGFGLYFSLVSVQGK